LQIGGGSAIVSKDGRGTQRRHIEIMNRGNNDLTRMLFLANRMIIEPETAR
jgi:hypothetical protein